MWTRKELKDKGKVSFRRNYWKAVLAAFVLTFAMGGGFFAANSSVSTGSSQAADSTIESTDSTLILGDDGFTMRDGNTEIVITSPEGSSSEADDFLSITLTGPDGETLDASVDATEAPWVLTPAVIIGAAIAALIALALALVVYAFIMKPLEAGCRGFFVANLNRKANIREGVSTFDQGYENCVKAMVLRDVFTFLWTLLFIIPGIVKSYEYRMIPYLVADNPNMTYKEAFAESRRLMHGNKWKTFVLDLSFIGWWILSALTLGILATFYVSPYHAATSAALYERLAYGDELPAFAAPVASTPAHAAQA